MRIAVTYDNGEVFQHFGHSESFKVYEVTDGKVTDSEVIGTDGAGHEALAGVLQNRTIDVLICGGLGGGAAAALEAAGIEVCSGVQGSADQAVSDYLAGKLMSAGVNCDHHDHHDHHGEEHSCGCGEEDGGCGDSCGGCGEPTILYEGKNAGKEVETHYMGTLNDGTKFDSSYDRGEPLAYTCGIGTMIPGYDKAVVNMEVGEVVDVHLMPEEAYGEVNPDAIFTMDIDKLPGAETLEEGQTAYLQNPYGQPFQVKVSAKDDTTITFDANHELAGKELNFRIELVSVED